MLDLFQVFFKGDLMMLHQLLFCSIVTLNEISVSDDSEFIMFYLKVLTQNSSEEG